MQIQSAVVLQSALNMERKTFCCISYFELEKIRRWNRNKILIEILLWFCYCEQLIILLYWWRTNLLVHQVINYCRYYGLQPQQVLITVTECYNGEDASGHVQGSKRSTSGLDNTDHKQRHKLLYYFDYFLHNKSFAWILHLLLFWYIW